MKNKFLKNASREYSSEARMYGMLVLGVIFLGLLPTGLVSFGSRLDQRFGLPPLAFGGISLALGILLVVSGLAFGWWSCYMQFTLGRGTPVPIMATQQLITQKPYSLCRNPMALGALLLFSGIAVLAGSISGLGLVLIFWAILLVYIRLVEEKEMELRFGEAYREYRKHTPFIIPRFR